MTPRLDPSFPDLSGYTGIKPERPKTGVHVSHRVQGLRPSYLSVGWRSRASTGNRADYQKTRCRTWRSPATLSRLHAHSPSLGARKTSGLPLSVSAMRLRTARSHGAPDPVHRASIAHSRLPVDQGAVAVDGEGGHLGEIGGYYAGRPRRERTIALSAPPSLSRATPLATCPRVARSDWRSRSGSGGHRCHARLHEPGPFLPPGKCAPSILPPGRRGSADIFHSVRGGAIYKTTKHVKARNPVRVGP